ncbi:TlpA family protein disulfide reductase [Chryseobacterium lacus]|uniref:TlpA family protein disulfide reductase n=1 Tax=Chryseobacterium lacus TaxID=2058346 RepID=A0A368MYT5_9FLAO|nr:TlpA disulfide reductase family protein [Chryseobacterium lacus]RCU42485.1 TlpA family protein disulfide reductase [Chryseobacterium lacus]RST27046.1 TlpA family protein disulfide reductase [Chryseobacterium lacus]
MDKIKKWLRNNWGTAIMFLFFLLLLVSPNFKTWVMRQIISTGIMNAKVEKKEVISSSKTPAENFMVMDNSGNTINTSDLKGKVVFMNFWASWCPPCRAEFPSIQKFYERYKDNPGVIFLTVNLDEDPGLGEAYLKKEQFTVPFLVPAGNIPSAYFSGSLPTTVVLDKNGGIRLQHAGMADYSKASFYKEIDALLDE